MSQVRHRSTVPLAFGAIPGPIVTMPHTQLAQSPPGMVSTVRVWLMLLAGVLVGAAPAAAQAPAPDAAIQPARTSRGLPTVTVVGIAPGELERVPGSTAVVDSAMLTRLRPVSIKEPLRKVPGVHVQDEDAFGLNLNIGVRGLPARRSSRVLLLEDGAPVHLGPYSDPSAHYHPPVDALARIEVLKGSGQILHGPQTIGGVINFVRAVPPATPGGTITLAGGTRDFAAGRLAAGGTWGGRGFALDAVRKQGAGTRRLHRHEIIDVVLRGVFPFGAGQRLSLKAGMYGEDSRYGEAGIAQTEFDADPYSNPLPNDKFDLTRHAAQAVHQLSLGAATLRTHVYAQRVLRTAWRQGSTSNDRIGNPGYARAFSCRPGAISVADCGNVGRPRTYTFGGLEPRLNFPHRVLGMTGELDAGMRGHHEHMVRQERAGDTPDARHGPITRDNRVTTGAVALFAQDRLTRGAWTVTPGVRVERVAAKNVNRIRGDLQRAIYTELLPGVGVAYNGWRQVTLFAGAHRGFAPPRPAEILDPAAGEGIVQVDAETSRSYEAGLRTRPAGWATVEVTFFRVDFDNQIVKGDLVGSGQRYVNGGRTLHQGLEAGGAADIGRLLRRPSGFAVDLGYLFLPTARFASDRVSTVDRRTSVRDRRLPFAPRHLVSAGAQYEHRSGARLRVDGDAATRQFADDLNTKAPTPNGQRGVLPRYSVLNASVALPTPRAGMTLFLDVKNFTDAVVITDRQEGIMVGMPRLATAGATWTF